MGGFASRKAAGFSLSVFQMEYDAFLVVFLHTKGARDPAVNAIDDLSFHLLQSQVATTSGATQLLDPWLDNRTGGDSQDFATDQWAFGESGFEQDKGQGHDADE